MRTRLKKVRTGPKVRRGPGQSLCTSRPDFGRERTHTIFLTRWRIRWISRDSSNRPCKRLRRMLGTRVRGSLGLASKTATQLTDNDQRGGYSARQLVRQVNGQAAARGHDDQWRLPRIATQLRIVGA